MIEKSEVRSACSRIMNMDLHYACAENILCDNFLNRDVILTESEKNCIVNSILFDVEKRSAHENYLRTAKGGMLDMPYSQYVKLREDEKEVVAKRYIEVKDEVRPGKAGALGVLGVLFVVLLALWYFLFGNIRGG